MILGEAVAISLLGGAIGFLLSTLLTGGVQHSPVGGFLPTAMNVFEPSVAMVCILTAGGIGLMSSLIPAVGASRTPIVEALRSTD